MDLLAYYIDRHAENDLQRNAILNFHHYYLTLIKDARGSSHNHQNWIGGYYDHIVQCVELALLVYPVLHGHLGVGFSIPDVVKVLYFHDVEKIGKYTNSLPANFDKWLFLTKTLEDNYGIKFNDYQLNALKYIHGEGEDYKKDMRIMNPLAAFCHCIDVMSSRIFYERDYKGKVRVK